MENETVHPYELYHHGILGQRWGIRRFQNADGSLTSSGRKRMAKSKRDRIKAEKTKISKKLKKIKDDAAVRRVQKKGAKEIAKAEKKYGVDKIKAKQENKPISQMTNKELQDKINRLRLEQQLKDLQPEKKSLGKEFAQKMWKDALEPALVNTAKDLGSKYIDEMAKKTLKIEPSEMDKLKKAAEKAGYEKTIADARKAKADANKAELDVKANKAQAETNKTQAEANKTQAEADKTRVAADEAKYNFERKKADAAKTVMSQTVSEAKSHTSPEAKETVKNALSTTVSTLKKYADNSISSDYERLKKLYG